MALHNYWNTAKRSLGMALMRAGGRLTGYTFGVGNTIVWQEMSNAERYAAMWAYYRSNNLYEIVNELAKRAGLQGWESKPLRNPTHRVVEFHATHLWPGTLPDCLPIEGTFQYKDEIHQILEWSNWGQRKQVAARWYTLTGDMFLKVSTKQVIDTEATAANDRALIDAGMSPDDVASTDPLYKVGRVYIQLIRPEHVTKIEKDHRGYFTEIRLDIPEDEPREDGRLYYRTELWDKVQYQIFVHDKGPDATEEELGDYLETSGLLADIFPGMDFVPFTHAKFLDAGDERGWPCIHAALDKIDEANRQATRQSAMLFRHNKALWAALSNRVGRNGEPMPAPSFRDPDTGNVPTWEDGDVVEIPGMADIKSLVPSIDYKAALDSIRAIMDEIEQDLPELRYNNMSTPSNIAAETLGKMMAPALDRGMEARGNAETALIQALQMALTIGAAAGLFKIPGGAFEAGKLAFSFQDRPYLDISSADAAELSERWAKVGLPLKTILREAGWDESKIDQAMKDAEEERKRKGASLTAALAAQRDNFLGGGQPGEPADPDRTEPTPPEPADPDAT